MSCHLPRVVRWVLGGTLALLPVPHLRAQNPDLILSQAERDSILKTYRNRFPIWGRKAIERGFDLPYSAGLSINAVWIDQNIDITNLGLSTGDNPVAPAEFIQIGKVEAPVYSVNLRGDLWLFPFLNVYAFGGRAWVTTDVTVVEPITFQTDVDQEGTYGGIGLTATMGVKHNWLAFDWNMAWTDTDKLDHPVRASLFGIRYGRAQQLRGTARLAFWLGAMRQKLVSGTDGTVTLDDLIDDGGQTALQQSLPGYQTSAWYGRLSTEQRRSIDAMAGDILGGDLENVAINYSLDKAVSDPWNMLAGLSYDFSKRWQARIETGFIGRTQVLLHTNYRFNW